MNWQKMFPPHILDRGFGYYQDGLVEEYETDSDYIQAVVQGSSTYDVRIDLANGSIADMECDCPYAANGDYCKHMAALLFYMEGEKKGADHSKPKKRCIPVKSETKPAASIDELVKHADEAVVKEFLTKILKQDDKLYNRFRSLLCCDISQEDMKRYKKQINGIFRKSAGRYNFIDYHHAGSFVSELDSFLNNEIAEMLDNEQYKEAFELTNHIFLKIGNQDMDDSDGGIGMLADMCLDIWQEVLEYSDLKLKKEMFQWCMKHLDGSVIDYMEDYIEEFLFQNFKEEDFLDAKLKFAEAKVKLFKQAADAWSRDYHAGKWAVRYIELLKEMKMPREQVWDYCKANIELKAVRQYFIKECIESHHFEAAIQLLKEGKEKEKSLPGVVADYSIQLKNLYRETGRMEEYREELWLLLLKYKAGDLGVFRELKQLYTPAEWEVKREMIFGKLPAYAAVDKLYQEEGQYDKLLKVVLEAPGLHKLMEYERDLKKLYPVEILNKYETVLEKMAAHTSSRQRYRELVTILKRMNAYPDGESRAKGIVENWRIIYRNRSAMLDELQKL